MATPNFTMVFLDFEDSVTFVHGSCIVRSSFVHRLVVGVLESCSDAEATWRRRCDEAELGKTGEVVRRNVSRTRPLAAPGRPWPPLAAPGHVVMANVTDSDCNGLYL